MENVIAITGLDSFEILLNSLAGANERAVATG